MAEAFAIREVPAVNEAQWRAFAADRPALRLELLQEFAAEPGRALQIFTYTDSEGLVCAAVATIAAGRAGDVRLERILFGRGHRIGHRLGLAGRPYLCVASPLGQDSGVIVRAGDGARRHGWLEGFIDELERWADRAGTGLVFLAVPEAEQPLFDLLRQRGYLSSKSRPNTVMPIRWRGFDEYRTALAAGHANIGVTLLQERKRNRDAGVVIRRIEPTVAAARRLYGLARAHYYHKNRQPLPYEQAFLERLLPRLGDDVLVLEATRGGTCCAIVAVLKSARTGWAAFLGLDPQARRNDFTYFNLTFYSLVEHAADFGLQAVWMGNGAYQAKLRRGCELVPVRFFSRPRDVWHRLLLRPWFALHRRWTRRKFA